MRGAFLAFVALAGAAGCTGGGTPPAAPMRGWNLVLVTLDTTRGDHLGCNGSRAACTPALDRLARRGVLCEDATSQVPLTLPAHATLFTGTDPTRHGVRGNGAYRLPEGRTTLAEILRGAGYRTEAVVAAVVLSRRHGLDQGFDHYDDDPGTMHAGGPGGLPERPAAEVAGAALEALARLDRERPFFLWAHFYDPHTPYTPAEPLASAFLKKPAGRYRAEIAWMDRALGALLRGLEQDGRMERTLVVIVGDHGEGVAGPHAEEEHGVLLYEDTLHVPLLWCAPPVLPAGRHLRALARQVDLLPTILDLLGVRARGPGTGDEIQGRSLRPLLMGGEDAPREEPPPAAYAETLHPFDEYGWAPLYALRQGRWKYIEAPEAELYDLVQDPAESRNVAGREPARAAELRARLREIRAHRRGADARETRIPVGPEELARLRALGYTGAGSGGEPPPEGAPGAGGSRKPLKDPKEWIGLASEISLALRERAAGGTDRARERLEDVLARDPDNYAANVHLADLLRSTGRLRDAEAPLRRLLELRPDRPQNLLRLAQVEFALADRLEHGGAGGGGGAREEARRRRAEAEGEIRRALEHEILDTAALARIAGDLNRRRRFDLAEAVLRRALSIEPRSPVVNLDLGLALEGQGRPAEARPFLLAAERLAGNNPPIRRNLLPILGEVEFRLGHWGGARRCFEALLSEFPKDPRRPSFEAYLREIRTRER